jgi:glycosyltransferase involved in cell wall biosynthesis
MKILWLNSGFLHPTTRGGQIRTLQMLRQLRKRHEIHYVALHDGEPEALEHCSEYCSRAWPVARALAGRGSLGFWAGTVRGMFTDLPVIIARRRAPVMRRLIEELLREEHFDLVVCDFLIPAVNLPPGQPFVLFEHNVETTIWRRYAEVAKDPVQRLFFTSQADRLLKFEHSVCRRAAHVIAVSEDDASSLRELCGISNVSTIPTGVDVAYFARPPAFTAPCHGGLVFAGSMDWRPNIEGLLWFTHEVLPLIHQHLSRCTLTIAGSRPKAPIRALTANDPRVHVTGTVDDIRPYLWAGGVSIVPIRIGSGTRLKIYESLAAEIPVVSTSMGAQGLEVNSPDNIRITDTPEAFAAACLNLLCDADERARQVAAGRRLVLENYSWESVVARFEEILESTVMAPQGSGSALEHGPRRGTTSPLPVTCET